MIDGARAQLDRERDRPRLRELIPVEPQREARVPAGFEVPPRLGRVEGAALEEHVACFGEQRRSRQNLVEEEVEIRVGVAELGRHGMRAKPGRDAARCPDCAELCELGVAIEPIARLRLEGRRAMNAHPAAMSLGRCRQLVLARGARRSHGGKDPAACCVQLLIAGAGGAQRELADAISGERRMRVAVDEPWDRGQATAVDLDDITLDRAEVGHPPHRFDRAAMAQDKRVLHDLDRRELWPTQWRFAQPRRGDLREVAHKQPLAHALEPETDGRSRPPTRAASSASGYPASA